MTPIVERIRSSVNSRGRGTGVRGAWSFARSLRARGVRVYRVSSVPPYDLLHTLYSGTLLSLQEQKSCIYIRLNVVTRSSVVLGRIRVGAKPYVALVTRKKCYLEFYFSSFFIEADASHLSDAPFTLRDCSN